MTMLGRYRIDSMLGEGAMAEVYRAHDPDIDRTVAIKVLKSEFARDAEINGRFLREARAAGALNHPHIATIYDVGETDGIAYIAMELIDGQPLDELLQTEGRLSYERVLAIGRQLAGALGYAHSAGVVHRDVKPSNILLSADGKTAKLLDFGVARIGEVDAATANQQMARTQVGQLIGTPRYMSPEQALGLPVDHRSDLFSLGVILYEMVTGKVAFPGTALATLAIQIAQEKVEPIDRSAADCPPGFRFIVDKLLAKKPEQRFASGAALEAAFDREISARNDAPAGRRGVPLRIKLSATLAIVTAISLFICVTVGLSRERSALERMAMMSGNSTATFITSNAAVLAADNAGLPVDQQDWSALQAFAVSAGRDSGIRDLVIADADGVIRAASDRTLVGARYRPPTDETVMQSGAMRASSMPDMGRGAGIRFVQPISYAGANFGKVDLVMRRTALDGALNAARNSMLILSAVVMLVVLLIGYLSGAMVARPLARLRRALDDAAASGFQLRISHNRRDEIGAVFDAFNRAAVTLENRLAGPHDDAKAMLATRIARSTKIAA
ncbi:serine/threonine-protein kinase [Sphingomonas sp. LT1P40]|uniref:serine/threonine-protein kinase n=1 Tax=Alteristakelama amylovorans TaxID=3096166 RepID=UPI002FCC7BC4